ncbi:zinc-dependent metalloprotease [Nocardioides sp. CFH 31398]|uniref:zinc-dependent metalloprotease n=1 Tax=Nocardioides sp. CFH 31398 TaxID=2919579 RepID=UPI001F062E4C|nr:zinc-dependent metalloprotease [Nocardioides sp. CFH 31398]MCH1866148.1 zinc-dependent metalloprotease [Nocardioides sp. CFH 31398]
MAAQTATAPGMVDWELAVRVGSRLAGEGPAVDPGEARRAVAELRAGATRSTGLVAEFTGLHTHDAGPPVLVVDRAGWVQATSDGFATVMEPLVDKLTERRGAPGPVARAVGSRVTGTEVGVMLGFLGGKVLGQYDPFHEPGGRLLLVAPNVVHVEREIEADPSDFRLWVCLHEETHRVQFTAVPWLRGHLFDLVRSLGETVDTSTVKDLVAGDGLKRLSESLRGEGSGAGLLDLVSTPEQREIMDRVTAVMSLLEGHADVVMDGVGPRVIPSVGRIRKSFDARRGGVGTLDRLLRRLLGLDAKMAQYRDGAAFVRGVVDRVGMERFNAVWAAPENLPTRADLAAPEAWVARVL